MIPESIKAEIEAKGGLLGAPEPQGNGTTIYRAADGSYIVVHDATGLPRMRGVGPAPAPSTQQAASPPAAPASAPAPARGAAGMNQEELERRIAQVAPNSDPSRLEFSRSVTKRKVSRPNAYGITEEVDENVPTLTWVDRGTGRTLRVIQGADGVYDLDFDGVDQKNLGDPSVPAQTPTQAASAAVGTATGNTREGTKAGKKVKEVEYVLPDGTRDWRVQESQAEKPTAAELVGTATGNTRERTEGGKKIKEVEYALPDGKREWRSQESEAGQPKSAEASDALEGQEGWRVVKRAKTDAQGNSVTETVYVDPQGQEHATPPAKQPTSAEVKTPVKEHPGWTEVKTGTKDAQGNQTGETYYLDPQGQRQSSLPDKDNIKGVPSFTPDLTKPGVGLIDRAKQLDELLAAGTITWEQRQRVLQADQLLASTVANEFNTGATLLREDFQNQVSQRNADVTNAQHRASLANTHVQNALGMVTKFSRFLGETPGDAGKLFRGLMAGQLALATSYGGMKDFPREQLPTALREFAERATGAAGTAGSTGSATGAPASPAPTPSVAPASPAAAVPAVTVAPAVPATDTTDAGGAPREYTPAAATSAMGPRPTPAAERLFGQQMPQPRPPEADSWRQQALDRQSVALGQNVLGAPPAALGVDDGEASFNRPIAPILNTQIPGLTPELDQLARQQLDTDYFGIG